jgi:hypothetical protein
MQNLDSSNPNSTLRAPFRPALIHRPNCDVGNWHKADITSVPPNVRFWGQSGHCISWTECPLFSPVAVHHPRRNSCRFAEFFTDCPALPSGTRRGVGRLEGVTPLLLGPCERRPFSKILFLGAFASSLVVVAVPILFRADMQSVTANRTLNCYDSAGNYEPCVTRASASPSQFNGRTTGAHQPASWTTTALYQQAIWPTNAVDQSANWYYRRSRSTSKSDNKRTTRAAQQYASKTPSHLRATFSATSLLRLPQGPYACCINCCNRGAASFRKGTPIAERVFYVL